MNRYIYRINLPVFFFILFVQAIAIALPATEQSEEVIVQNFFNYLLTPKTDIASDASAQNTWLTSKLRNLLVDTTSAVTQARKLPEVEGPDPAVPDNGTFLASWDYPTTCNALKPVRTPKQTRVMVVCNWGPNTQYPGEVRKATVFLEREDIWRISDIQFHKSKYADESNLIRDLKSLKLEAEALLKKHK